MKTRIRDRNYPAVKRGEIVGVIEPHTRDDEGRVSFTLFWWADYHPGHPEGENRWAIRAQCYFAKPENHPNVSRWIEHKPENYWRGH